ncbi:hypothetical protein QJS10_CPB22g00824 [Acorus calamus]|uniref:Uncharacterized protein n=1 Tax=Acorus calamus TaxID=4465 RepID=A0AAV9C3H0_ACOCL|nr:hypothetical protein QJS10_CPB22g00824 [Acorus calamus]
MKQSAAQTKLPQQQPPPPSRNKDDLSWMPPIGAIFLIFNSIFAIYRSRDDIPTVVFIIAANIALAFLFGASVLTRMHRKNRSKNIRSPSGPWPLC